MKVKGQLFYLGWFNQPWRVVTETGDVDLWPLFEAFFQSLHGRRAKEDFQLYSYQLAADETADDAFEYVPGQSVLLRGVSQSRISNVVAWLGDCLQALNGRNIAIECDSNRLAIGPDPNTTEVVPIIHFKDGSNICEVPPGSEKTVCKFGTPEVCVFFALGEDGFACLKFCPSSRLLLNRVAKGEMKATRIGNCAVVGRSLS